MEVQVNVERMNHETTPQKLTKKKNPLSCHICQESFSTRKSMYSHYTLKHYRKEVQDYLGETHCTLCPRTNSAHRKNADLIHVGVTHSKFFAKTVPCEKGVLFQFKTTSQKK